MTRINSFYRGNLPISIQPNYFPLETKIPPPPPPPFPGKTQTEKAFVNRLGKGETELGEKCTASPFPIWEIRRENFSGQPFLAEGLRRQT